VTKKRSKHPAAVEKDELRKDGKKSWKTKILWLIYIVLNFF